MKMNKQSWLIAEAIFALVTGVMIGSLIKGGSPILFVFAVGFAIATIHCYRKYDKYPQNANSIKNQDN